jgi:hypothetical protein
LNKSFGKKILVAYDFQYARHDKHPNAFLLGQGNNLTVSQLLRDENFTKHFNPNGVKGEFICLIYTYQMVIDYFADEMEVYIKWHPNVTIKNNDMKRYFMNNVHAENQIPIEFWQFDSRVAKENYDIFIPFSSTANEFFLGKYAQCYPLGKLFGTIIPNLNKLYFISLLIYSAFLTEKSEVINYIGFGSHIMLTLLNKILHCEVAVNDSILNSVSCESADGLLGVWIIDETVVVTETLIENLVNSDSNSLIFILNHSEQLDIKMPRYITENLIMKRICKTQLSDDTLYDTCDEVFYFYSKNPVLRTKAYDFTCSKTLIQVKHQLELI